MPYIVFDNPSLSTTLNDFLAAIVITCDSVKTQTSFIPVLPLNVNILGWSTIHLSSSLGLPLLEIDGPISSMLYDHQCRLTLALVIQIHLPVSPCPLEKKHSHDY